MHEKSRWPNISITCLFTEIAHFSDKKPRWLKIWSIQLLDFDFFSYLEPFRFFFGWKNEPSQWKDTWSICWVIFKLSHLDFSCISLHVRHVSFDDSLSHLKIPSVPSIRQKKSEISKKSFLPFFRSEFYFKTIVDIPGEFAFFDRIWTFWSTQDWTCIRFVACYIKWILNIGLL